MLVTSLTLQARLKGCPLTLEVADDVRIGPRFKVSLDRGSACTLRMAAGVQIYDNVTLLLRGGTVELGPRASIRHGSILNVSGHFALESDNIISYYNVIHCAERIRLARWASTNEFVTLVDSRHFHGGEHEFFYENVESSPIEVGRNVWIANKASVLMGVTIGDDAIVAGHAVVHSDVPAKSVVGGIPARVIRQS